MATEVPEGPRSIPLKVSEVASCSRRSDIPAFKMDWVLDCIRAGRVYVAPVRASHAGDPSRGSCVSLARGDVRAWVWWSKDYAPWIRAFEGPSGDLLRQYDAHIFNFTINGEPDILEPGLRTTLDERLGQLAWIAANFGPESIVLRFDPIVHYELTTPEGTTQHDNLVHLQRIISFATLLGIKFIVVAFAIAFPRVVARMRSLACHGGPRIRLVAQTPTQKRAIIESARDYARTCVAPGAEAMQIQMCCVDTTEVGGDIEDVGASACINGTQINDALLRAGRPPLKSTKKDAGQRAICRCTKSTDIAGYGADFACPHKCVYCYANPQK